MNRPARILVVEDNAAMRESCTKLFRLEGYDVAEAPTADDALRRLKQRNDIDIVLTDIKMPGIDGVALLKEIKLLGLNVQVALMTGYGSVKNAVEAMKHGAADYITKPFDANELLVTIGKIIQFNGLREEVLRLRSELQDKYGFDNIVGASPGMMPVYEKIEAARKTDSTVLICGESGTGKELVAKAIHYSGPRAEKPFVPVNCAAMPGELIESELFGHKKGAYTGASSDSEGLFRAADGGTIFLDEILEMPHASQAKLLRVLQEKKIRPVGGAEEVPVDARVIASTNRRIGQTNHDNQFREDLYYRLSVIRIQLPPLRKRAGDIPLLVHHFIAGFNSRFGRAVKGMSEDALNALTRYHWPGNVRELQAAIESSFALGKSDTILKSDLPGHIIEMRHADSRPPGDDNGQVQTLLETERELLVQALEATKGNKTHAAELLGVSRPRLYKMIQRHRLEQSSPPSL